MRTTQRDRRAFPEFGFYAQPGHVFDAPRVLDDTRTGEALGLGSLWISERLGAKDAPVLSGAAAAVSDRIHIGSGLIANLPLRHPLAVASYGATMSLLSGGRFVLGIGRGQPALAKATHTPNLTFEILESYVAALRALWRGEAVSGTAGGWQMDGVSLGMELADPPPIIMGVEGDKTAQWAGRVCDGVMIQGLWNVEGTAHTARLVRAGAEAAGRDPAEVEILAALITACEVSEEEMLQTIIRRWNTYMHYPVFLDNVCRINGWDRKRMEDIRERVNAISLRRRPASSGPWGDENVSRELGDLIEARDLYPTEWLHAAFAVGDRRHCAQAVRDRMDAGCDGIIFHGTTPANLKPLIEAWPDFRPTREHVHV